MSGWIDSTRPTRDHALERLDADLFGPGAPLLDEMGQRIPVRLVSASQSAGPMTG